MEWYQRVRGKKRVDAIAAAIRASGGEIVEAPHGDVAPFVFDVRLDTGQRHRIICYAFTANRYEQEGRPKDEHRFQVKYGSDFTRLHELAIRTAPNTTTLFFGVYEDGDLFVAADPAMHNPTWFSSSVEFKAADVSRARRTGWHGWQRERVAGGRRRIELQHNESLLTETLHAFRPEHFLTYVRLERLATGIDPGERLVLIASIGKDLTAGKTARSLVESQHVDDDRRANEFLKMLGLSVDEMLDVIVTNPRLATAMRGGVAERHLFTRLKRTAGLSNLEKTTKDGEPDFSFGYRGRTIRLECKLVAAKLTRRMPLVDFQKTRASKNDKCSRFYGPDQFEVLAACVHPITQKWDYQFALTRTLPPHPECGHKLSTRISVEPSWPSDIIAVIEQLSA